MELSCEHVLRQRVWVLRDGRVSGHRGRRDLLSTSAHIICFYGAAGQLHNFFSIRLREHFLSDAVTVCADLCRAERAVWSSRRAARAEGCRSAVATEALISRCASRSNETESATASPLQQATQPKRGW